MGSTDPEMGKTNRDNGAFALLHQEDSDLRLLKSGDFSDFTIICGELQWPVHRSILSKVPYFNTLFQESPKGTHFTVDDFQPFEVDLFLSYIYFPLLNPETDRETTDTKSYLELCVRLWTIADSYDFKPMSLQALNLLEERCNKLCDEIVSSASTEERLAAIHQDLEPAIRQAWDKLNTSAPVRGRLIQPVMAMASYLGNQETFVKLIAETPDFAIDLCKATMRFFASGAEEQAKNMLSTSIKTSSAPAKDLKLAIRADKSVASADVKQDKPGGAPRKSPKIVVRLPTPAPASTSPPSGAGSIFSAAKPSKSAIATNSKNPSSPSYSSWDGFGVASDLNFNTPIGYTNPFDHLQSHSSPFQLSSNNTGATSGATASLFGASASSTSIFGSQINTTGASSSAGAPERLGSSKNGHKPSASNSASWLVDRSRGQPGFLGVDYLSTGETDEFKAIAATAFEDGIMPPTTRLPAHSSLPRILLQEGHVTALMHIAARGGMENFSTEEYRLADYMRGDRGSRSRK